MKNQKANTCSDAEILLEAVEFRIKKLTNPYTPHYRRLLNIKANLVEDIKEYEGGLHER